MENDGVCSARSWCHRHAGGDAGALGNRLGACMLLRNCTAGNWREGDSPERKTRTTSNLQEIIKEGRV
jgi:hypothetical protein